MKNNGIKRKLTSMFLAAIAGVMMLSMPVMAASELNAEKECEILSVEQLKREIVVANLDGIISDAEAEYLEKATNPAVSNALVIEKMEIAFAELENVNVKMRDLGNDISYGVTEIDLGDGCTARFEFTDCPEGESAIVIPGEMLSTYATSGSSTVSKGYGNRYFTAKGTVACGAGTATLILENHYNLSAENGITERYGVAASNSVSIGGTISEGTPQINVANADAVGESASIFCTYKAQGSVENVNYSQSFKVTSSVKYISHSMTLDLYEIQQSWKLYSY